jgi:NodT family efflux transporter outer membrane factor (OMF) lipoprotein
MTMKTIAINHRHRSGLWPSILACFLSACAVGPDFVAPNVDVGTSFTRSGSDPNVSSTPLKVDPSWWKTYQNESLNALINKALEHNPNVQTALSNLKLAQQNTIAQEGFFFPSLGFGYSASRQNGGATLSPNVNNVAANSAYNLHTAALTVGFVPDLFGVNRRQVESLKAQETAQAFQLKALQTTLIANVIATATQVAALQEQESISRRMVKINELQLTHIQRMFKSGYSSGIDLANQQSNLAMSQSQLSAVVKNKEQSIDLLNVLCGENPEKNLPLPQLSQISIPSNLPHAVPSAWISQRPDVSAAQEMVKASNAQIGVAIGNMIPQISLSGISGSSASSFAQLKDSVNKMWSSALNVNQSLYAGGTLMARKKAAEFGLEASVEQYRSTVLTALQNVADTMYALSEDQKNLEYMQQAETANEHTYELSQLQFKTGYISEPGALSSELLFLQAKLNKIQALGVYLSDSVSLFQSLGGSWK